MSELGVLDLRGLGGYGQDEAATPAATVPRQTANMASYYRDNPALIQAVDALTQQVAYLSNRVMALEAQRKLGQSKQRIQTAYTDTEHGKWLTHMTGIKPQVDATQAGKAMASNYSPPAYTRRLGWMPGCSSVCPTNVKSAVMGVRASLQPGGQEQE